MKIFTMKKLWLNAFALLCIVNATLAQTYEAKLTGAQETLPVTTRATGTITAVLTGNQLVVTGSFSGLEGDFDASVAGGSHLHIAPIGSNGSVAHILSADVSTDLKSGSYSAVNNTFTLSALEVLALQNRGMYFNLHTTKHAGGELRGQLVPAGSTVYLINLFGSNEVPSIMTDAHGAILLDLMGTTLTASGSFSGLEGDFDANIAGGAHLHNGMAGENGGVIYLLNTTLAAGSLTEGVFDPTNNVFTITAADMDLLEARSVYANIHTTKFAGGELRGNVTKNPNSIWRAHLAGYNEVPVVTTKAHGSILLELDGNTLTASGTFADFMTPFDANIAGGAHIHTGMAGQTGGVIAFLNATAATDNLSGTFEAANNITTLSSGLIDTLYNRGLYANLHSQGNAAGEVRGQIVPSSNYYFNAFMSGNFEAPAILSTGEGFAIGEVLGEMLTITGSFSNMMGDFDANVAGGSHIHSAYAGSNGGIVSGLFAMVSADGKSGVFGADSNMIMLDAMSKQMLRDREIYTNIHTTAFASGELRGQMLHEATAYFIANLSGGVEVPPAITNAYGAIAIELAGNQAILTGSFNDLSSPFDAAVAGGSHIHSAWPGQNGGVNIILDANTATNNLSGMYMANSNMYTLSSGAIDTLMMRMNYVNIHTSAFGGGELRGQIVPLANSYLFTNLAPIHTMPVVNTNARGALMVERVQNNIMLYGTFEGLESKVATAIAGGAHIHLGDVTTSGGVEFILNPAFAIDTMSASYDAMENSFSLTETQVSNLLMGDNYVNIHTINNQGGELRGQFLSDYNNAPDMNTISAPMNAATVNIDTNAFAQIEVMWSMADDQNGNTVAYVWQLAADSNFTMPILAMAMGAEMSFTATHNMIDSVLGANGIAYGDTAMLYHRVIATDGSLESMSQSYTVNFVRTGVLSVSEIQDYELSVYPNPSSETVYIKWNGNASKIESIQIIDVSGRLVSSQNRLNNSNGLTTIDVGAFKSGLYFVSLVQENGSTKTSSLVVK